jgi:hypothetical protein
VSEQRIEDGMVTIDRVVSDGPGWVVIHNQEDLAPGAVLGRAQVSDGENTDVSVEIDVSQATGTIYAVLHGDTGEEGVFDFPDGDDIVEVDGEPVMAEITLTGGMRASVTVEDQAIENDTVVVQRAVSDGPGWIVIHADDAGQPGEVIGNAALSDGENTDVSVEIDTEMATETLYAMLHIDDGEEGTYEFPDGDPPAEVEGNVVVQSFQVTGGLEEEPAAQEDATETPVDEEEEEATETPAEEEEEEEVLPETGAGTSAVAALALVVGGVIAMALGILTRRMRATRGTGTDD